MVLCQAFSHQVKTLYLTRKPDSRTGRQEPVSRRKGLLFSGNGVVKETKTLSIKWTVLWMVDYSGK